MRLVIDGNSYAEHGYTKTVEVCYNKKNQKKTYVERKRSCYQSTNEDLKSKKSKTYQNVHYFTKLIIRTITLLTFNFCCCVVFL